MKWIWLLLLVPNICFASPITGQNVYQLANKERVKAHVAPLTYNKKLETAASLKFKDMVQHHYFNHISPTGVYYYHFIDKAGYQWTVSGENLAKGYSSSEEVMSAFMHSPSHRANILKKTYTDTGVVRGFFGKTPVVVEMFGHF